MLANYGHVIVYRDDEGIHHFATPERPTRIVIDIHNLSIGFGWMSLNTVKKTITFSLDGEVLVYRRVGKDPHGWWVCDRVQDDDQLHGSDPAPDRP